MATQRDRWCNALADNPEDWRAWYNLGYDLRWSGQSRTCFVDGAEVNARQCFLKAVGINPESADSWYQLAAYGGIPRGETIDVHGEPHTAVGCLVKSLTLAPANPWPWYDLAVVLWPSDTVLIREQRYSKRNCILNALAKFNFTWAWYELGIHMTRDETVEIREGRYSRQDCFRRAVESDTGGNPHAWYNLGNTLGRTDSLDVLRVGQVTAADCYRRTLAQRPVPELMLLAWYNLGAVMGPDDETEVGQRNVTRRCCFIAALAIDQTFDLAWCSLGLELEPDEAIVIDGDVHTRGSCLAAALEHNPYNGVAQRALDDVGVRGDAGDARTTTDCRVDYTRVLGAGGFGRVYSAVDRDSKMPVAVKEVRASHAPLAAEALQREYAMLRGLSHPHIVRVQKQEAAGGRVQRIVMELLPGGSVEGLLAATRFRLHEGTVRNYARQALLALKHLHDASQHGDAGAVILHRDVKPANMLLDAHGCLKLSDFGLSCRTDATQRRQSATPCGTLPYMAPEVRRFARYSPGSDVWALACSVVEMTSGPWWHFHATRRLEDAGALARDARPAVPPHLSAALQQLLTRCFAVDEKDRPSAAALLADAYFTDDGIVLREGESMQAFEDAMAAGVGRAVELVPPTTASAAATPWWTYCVPDDGLSALTVPSTVEDGRWVTTSARDTTGDEEADHGPRRSPERVGDLGRRVRLHPSMIIASSDAE